MQLRFPSWRAATRQTQAPALSVLLACCAALAIPQRAFAQQAGFLACPAPFGVGSSNRMTAPSFNGGPGLFEVPTATSLPDGELMASFNKARLLNYDKPLLWQNNGFFSVTFLPRITLTARGTVHHTGRNDWDLFLRDLSANVQVQLLEERGWRPALMAGMHDVNGANALYTAKYAAVTKSFAGRVRLTGGYGQGLRKLDGPFGGIEVAPCPWITLIAEYDGQRRSAGVRLLPFPSMADRLGVRPTLDASWLGEQGFVGGVGVRFAAGPARQHRPLSAVRPSEAKAVGFGPSAISVERAAAAARNALVAEGLENVRVLPVADGLLDVQYENRRWLLDDMDGLGVVLATISRTVPDEVRRVRLTIRKVDIPVLVVTTALAPWRAFLADPRQERAFVQQLAIEYPSTASPKIEGVSANRSPFRVDFTARPRIEDFFLSELSALETRITLLPEFSAQLGRGFMLTGRRSIAIYQSSRFLDGDEDAGGDRLLLHSAMRLPGGLLPRGALGIGQLSVGRLGQRHVGANWDQQVELRGGRFALGVTGTVYGESATRIDKSIAYGTIRWRRPEQEITTSLSAGRFRFGDIGAVADISRRLGLVDVGFTLRVTNLSSQAGIRLTVPLSPRRQGRPQAVRLLLPDYFAQAQQVTVFEPFPMHRNDVARVLDIGNGVESTYAGRGWLNAVTLRSRAWALRNAALR